MDYHSPSVHDAAGVDRTGHIWGELVPFGLFDEGFGPSKATPWRAGANESTTVSFSHDVKVEGQDLKAGTYALFLLLDQSGPWTWIFSRSIGWGSYQYDPGSDVLRVAVTPQTAPFTEMLTYGFDDRRPESAVAFLQWETKRVPFRITVPNVNEVYVAEMRKELLAWPGFNYENWRRAAQFCAIKKVNLDEALVWADKAIHEPFRGAGAGGREEFSTLRTKAAVLEAMGRSSEADEIMKKAMDLPGTTVLQLHSYASTLLARGRKEEALAAFKLNQQRHPDERYWTYLGLARGFAAAGQKKEALRNWEIALRSVPESERSQLPGYAKAIEALKSAQ